LPTGDELAARDAPWTELIRRYREPRDPGSLGDITTGRRFGAVARPHEGPHHAVIASCRERETNWGTPDLVDVISRAARLAHEEMGGPRLMVCNLSRHKGGNIKWSRSHNS